MSSIHPVAIFIGVFIGYCIIQESLDISTWIKRKLARRRVMMRIGKR